MLYRDINTPIPESKEQLIKFLCTNVSVHTDDILKYFRPKSGHSTCWGTGIIGRAENRQLCPCIAKQLNFEQDKFRKLRKEKEIEKKSTVGRIIKLGAE